MRLGGIPDLRSSHWPATGRILDYSTDDDTSLQDKFRWLRQVVQGACSHPFIEALRVSLGKDVDGITGVQDEVFAHKAAVFGLVDGARQQDGVRDAELHAELLHRL